MDFDWISRADRLLGFGLLIVTVIGGVLAWLQRRGHSFVDDEVAPLRAGQKLQVQRMDQVEARLAGVERDVGLLEERTSRIESALPGLATKEDLTTLRVQIAEVGAKLDGVEGKIDTLYRAALAAGRRDE